MSLEDEFVKLAPDRTFADEAERAQAQARSAERFIIFEGWFEKLFPGSVGWKRCYFFLDNTGHLSYHEGLSTPALGTLNISDVSSIRMPDEISVELDTPSRTEFLRTSSAEDVLRFVRVVSMVKDKGHLRIEDLQWLIEDSKLVHALSASPPPPSTIPTHAPPPYAANGQSRGHPGPPPAAPSLIVPSAPGVAELVEDVFPPAASWDNYKQRNMLLKTLSKWVSWKLREKGVVVSDLMQQMRDGVVLLDLVEVLTGAPVQGPVCREPTRAVQRIMNVNFAIKRLRDTGKILPPIPAEDIVNGKQTTVLMLLWGLALLYEVNPRVHKGKKGAAGILAWAQECVNGCNPLVVQIDDFSSSFADGLALNMLWHSHDCNCCIPEELRKHSRLDNTSKALNTAERMWQIPRLLDAEDFAYELPDDKSLILYLAIAFGALQDKKWNW
jgi:hypothetical protein